MNAGEGVKTFAAPDLADENRRAEVVVIGSGVAGLHAALRLADGRRPVTLLTKKRLGTGGSSAWAQGGVAAAVGSNDSPAEHAEDTLAAGAGLSDAAAVYDLVSDGPAHVRRLIELGARFDRDAQGRLALGREGAHRHRRILHARGDATGAEMVRALVEAVRQAPGLTLAEGAFALDLAVDDGRVVGVVARHGRRTVFHRAPAVVLATGGFGQLYAHTTNPPEATGDGLAMAALAGARLADLEFVQFHPTALAAGGDPLPLLTEALRGEGAILVDETGERFMPAEHPLAELAPRDVVARAIWRRREAGLEVYLDAREAVGEAFPRRFPTVFGSCIELGIDPRRELMPVTPAAHYVMAGVAVDGAGRTSLDGLWACGEVTSSGVHGANRLASNSLLEALVYGARVADDVEGGGPRRALHRASGGAWVRRELGERRERSVREEIRRLAWTHLGLERDRWGLSTALEELRLLTPRKTGEVANLALVGRLVAAAALAREESRGAHCRSDFPEPRPEWRRRLSWTWAGGEGFPLESAGELELEREIA